MKKVILQEMTPEELRASADSLQELLERMQNRGESPLNHCFEQVRFYEEEQECDCDCCDHSRQ